ncbi:hypothetical protein CSOJ01_08091 [Colletotrichum sojae]|uniref:Uncharacterized protein n=1 Tax=Colletotrichum sojae TaxID=2175907 RepID=A0A8H6J7S4_9PEZI|nr:hypothetical protein CSOJ01_08091 [Colletotrichum sojae]
MSLLRPIPFPWVHCDGTEGCEDLDRTCPGLQPAAQQKCRQTFAVQRSAAQHGAARVGQSRGTPYGARKMEFRTEACRMRWSRAGLGFGVSTYRGGRKQGRLSTRCSYEAGGRQAGKQALPTADARFVLASKFVFTRAAEAQILAQR